MGTQSKKVLQSAAVTTAPSQHTNSNSQSNISEPREQQPPKKPPRKAKPIGNAPSNPAGNCFSGDRRSNVLEVNEAFDSLNQLIAELDIEQPSSRPDSVNDNVSV